MRVKAGLVLTAIAGVAAATSALAATTADKKVDTAIVAPKADPKAATSGVYTPDPNHRHLLFSYPHQGYSTSYVRWRAWDAELNWNADNPEKSTIAVTINTDKVDSGVDVFDGHLKSDKFFDAAKYPTITFKSTSVKKTGPDKGVIVGDLTIKGVTAPATLNVTFNKAAFEQRGNIHKIGFSAKGVAKRSTWGLDLALPFVGDDVTIVVEAEFMGPKAAQ